MDSRGSMTEQNKVTSYIIFHTRKKGLDFFYSTHRFGNVDKRIRSLTDFRLMPHIIHTDGGQVFCNVKVYLRSKYMDDTGENRYVYSHDFSLLANPIFRWFDTTSGIFEPPKEESRESRMKDRQGTKRLKKAVVRV